MVMLGIGRLTKRKSYKLEMVQSDRERHYDRDVREHRQLYLIPKISNIVVPSTH